MPVLVESEVTQTPFEDGLEWQLASDAHPEVERQSEEQLSRFLGRVVLSGEVEVETVETRVKPTTLLASLQQACLGDETALDTVWTNVGTDVGERLYKVENVSVVELQVPNGRLMQNGAAVIDIHRNTLEHTVLNPIMQIRTEIEAKNIFVFEGLLPTGVLKTHDALVCSTATYDEKTKKLYGFYAPTDTCSMQLLRVEGDTALLQTALVAGKKTPDSPRHDIDAIREMAASNGVVIDTDDADQMHRYIMLIPKSQIPNGISDVVAGYDNAAGGTFYGEAKPQRDYVQHAAECRIRNESFQDVVGAITTQLLNEVHTFETPIEAVERLDELSEWYCVKRAVSDRSIDAAVFGTVSAWHIDQTRMHLENGDQVQAHVSLKSAQQTATSSSCPLFKGSDSGKDGKAAPDESRATNEETSKGKKWMSCPHCSAKVYDDPCANVLSCWDCKAKVKNGRVVSTGNGGSKRREAEKAKVLAEKRKHQAELEQQAAEIAERVDEAFEDSGTESFENEQEKVRQTGKLALSSVQ